jgi:molybdopterin-guanine dinucleotide biosynthesis protein A
MTERAIGAVLAGGASRRMGRPKATLELAGQPLAARAVGIVETAGLKPVVVAKRDSPLPELPARIITEPDEPRHPLTGVLAAIRETRAPVVVLGCDMPLVAPALLAHLAGEITEPARLAVVAESAGELEPLLAAYAPAAEDGLVAALADRLPLRDAVASLGPDLVSEGVLRRFGDPRTLAFNLNSPADLERAAELLSPAARR